MYCGILPYQSNKRVNKIQICCKSTAFECKGVALVIKKCILCGEDDFMEGVDVVNEGGETVREDGLPREGREGFFCHGLTGDVSVLTYVVEDIVEIFLLLRCEGFALDEVDIFLACEVTVNTYY